MMDTPLKTVACLIVYWTLLVVLTKWMKNRPAFDLKGLLVIYNAIQVCGSFYIFSEVTTNSYLFTTELIELNFIKQDCDCRIL